MGVVELHEKHALLDLLVRFEGDLLDDARRLHRQIDAARRADGADRLDVGGPRHRFDLDGGDGERLHRHVGKEIRDRLVAEHVEADDAAHDQHEKHQGDDEALDQGSGLSGFFWQYVIAHAAECCTAQIVTVPSGR